MRRIFVSKKDENRLYDALVKFYSSNDEVIVYDRNLFNLLKRVSRLFDPETLEKELSGPDLVIVFLSRPYLEDVWLSNELNAFFMLEQRQKTDFIVPVLLHDINDKDIPLYLQERPERFVDIRGKTEEEGASLVAAHLSGMNQDDKRIFIGHGGPSKDWKDLRDYLEELHLECDYFDKEDQAGRNVTVRLGEMLSRASFAFIVMTAEDEHATDGRMHARENVVHEAGLFQGKLGFERAIILREDDCAGFSNIAGLQDIPFPKGRIDACFDKVRRVLKARQLLL
ncbi:MAG TPA: TIR domain-containing protein [Thermoanaerobaculia bacterium]|nr:TIR domain-containing protein [Thermoanaerobaculia bacterium]